MGSYYVVTVGYYNSSVASWLEFGGVWSAGRWLSGVRVVAAAAAGS